MFLSRARRSGYAQEIAARDKTRGNKLVSCNFGQLFPPHSEEIRYHQIIIGWTEKVAVPELPL
jgi:hypothetical protein